MRMKRKVKGNKEGKGFGRWPSLVNKAVETTAHADEFRLGIRFDPIHTKLIKKTRIFGLVSGVEVLVIAIRLLFFGFAIWRLFVRYSSSSGGKSGVGVRS